MIEVENTDVNIVRNLIPMRNHMPASAYGLKAISDWLGLYLIFGGCMSSYLTNAIYLKIPFAQKIVKKKVLVN